MDGTKVTSTGARALRDMNPKLDVTFSTRLSEQDLTEIKELVTPLLEGEDKLISIGHADEEGQVSVLTGVIRGPLNAGGPSYILKKKNGVWTIIFKGFWVS